jgi:hypothetical protein
MQALLAVKAHKARCIKILTQARKSLEEETDKLVDMFEKMKATSNNTCVSSTEEQAELEIDQEEPFTPSPTLPGPACTSATSLYFLLSLY